MKQINDINNYARPEYRVNLSSKFMLSDIREFKNAARDLFCHSCYNQPELSVLLDDISRIFSHLSAPMVHDSIMRSKRKDITDAVQTFTIAADACLVLLRMADSGVLSERDRQLLEQYERLNDRARLEIKK